MADKPYLAIVVWNDTWHRSGWLTSDTDLTPVRCESVGWVFHEDEQATAIFSTQNDELGRGDVTVMPTSCVIEIRKLKGAK